MIVNRKLLKGTLGRMGEEANLDCSKGTVESFVPDTVLHKMTLNWSNQGK
jgi:hypothetical protein